MQQRNRLEMKSEIEAAVNSVLSGDAETGCPSWDTERRNKFSSQLFASELRSLRGRDLNPDLSDLEDAIKSFCGFSVDGKPNIELSNSVFEEAIHWWNEKKVGVSTFLTYLRGVSGSIELLRETVEISAEPEFRSSSVTISPSVAVAVIGVLVRSAQPEILTENLEAALIAFRSSGTAAVHGTGEAKAFQQWLEKGAIPSSIGLLEFDADEWIFQADINTYVGLEGVVAFTDSQFEKLGALIHAAKNAPTLRGLIGPEPSLKTLCEKLAAKKKKTNLDESDAQEFFALVESQSREGYYDVPAMLNSIGL